jgi:hypothetical protein
MLLRISLNPWIFRKEITIMEEKKKITPQTEEKKELQGPETADWATQALEDMDDFIESQGIYIRQ